MKIEVSQRELDTMLEALRFLQLDLIQGETGAASPDALSADEIDGLWERLARATNGERDV